MANKAGSTDTPGPGHNEPPAPLTAEDMEALFLKHLKTAREDNAAMEKAMEAVRAVRKRRNNNRNVCKTDGFGLKHLDQILLEEARARHENEADAKNRTFMRRVARLPVTGDDEEQLDMFTAVTAKGDQSLDRDDAYWAGEGYTAGLRGLEADPAKYEVPPERGQVWLDARMQGQQKLAENLDRAKKIDKRRAADA